MSRFFKILLIVLASCLILTMVVGIVGPKKNTSEKEKETTIDATTEDATTGSDETETDEPVEGVVINGKKYACDTSLIWSEVVDAGTIPNLTKDEYYVYFDGAVVCDSVNDEPVSVTNLVSQYDEYLFHLSSFEFAGKIYHFDSCVYRSVNMWDGYLGTTLAKGVPFSGGQASDEQYYVKVGACYLMLNGEKVGYGDTIVDGGVYYAGDVFDAYAGTETSLTTIYIDGTILAGNFASWSDVPGCSHVDVYVVYNNRIVNGANWDDTPENGKSYATISPDITFTIDGAALTCKVWQSFEDLVALDADGLTVDGGDLLYQNKKFYDADGNVALFTNSPVAGMAYTTTKPIEMASFTCEGTTFTFEVGMTWAEFIASDYNVDDQFTSSAVEGGTYSEYVFYQGSELRLSDGSTAVPPTATIEAGHAYTQQ